MYKVLIVDDDMIVRVGIRMLGKWDKYDMELVGEASDGEQALEIYHLYKPDLIIADIKMPGMDGIDLLKKIREHSKETRVVLLTNYDDKENLKEALRYGANDFIVKNELNEESLERLLDKERTELSKCGHTDMSFQADLETKKKMVHFFMETVSKRKEFETEFVKKFRIGPEGCFRAGVIQVSFKKKSITEMNTDMETITRLQQIISGTLTGYSQAFIWDNKWKTVSIFVMDTMGKLSKESFAQLCTSISNAVRLYLRIITHVCASSLAEKIDDLYLLKHQLEKSVLAASFFVDDKVVMYDDLDSIMINRGCSSKYKNMLREMYLCSAGQVQKVRKICREILESASREKNVNLKSLLCSEFTAWYRRELNMLETVLGDKVAVIDYNLLLCVFDDKELKNALDLLLCQIEDAQSKFRITENEVINEALMFISQNYASPLSLGDVADHVHLSKNYVSTLFNNTIKQSFAEYLSRFRIEKAKEILRLTDYRISEVSELVGFSSEKYFSASFKNTVGITPKEFRQNQKDVS